MTVKTRHPYRLSDDDFDTFCFVQVKGFLAGDNSLPHRPDHLVAQQSALADDFHAKLDEYKASRQVRDNATSAFGEAAIAIREKLRWMIMALPGLTPGSDDILVPFGLDHDVPADNDEMKNYADAVYEYWLTVRDDPLFAVFQANIDALSALFTAYDNGLANQNVAQQAASLLQNEKDAIRKQSEEVIVAIIDWYRIYYRSPQNEYWTQTPFGKSSGGEPSGPPAPTGLAYNAVTGTFSWDAVEGATSYQLVYSPGGEVWDEAYDGADTSAAFNPGAGDWVFMVRARDAEGYGEWSGELAVHIESGELHPPTGLTAVYATPNSVELNWNAVPAADSYNIYRKVEPETEFTLIASTTNTTYTDNDASPPHQGSHFYYVTAVKEVEEGQEESEPSDIVEAGP